MLMCPFGLHIYIIWTFEFHRPRICKWGKLHLEFLRLIFKVFLFFLSFFSRILVLRSQNVHKHPPIRTEWWVKKLWFFTHHDLCTVFQDKLFLLCHLLGIILFIFNNESLVLTLCFCIFFGVLIQVWHFKLFSRQFFFQMKLPHMSLFTCASW